MKTFPVFLVGLEQLRCVVVGGDAVAEQKVKDLLAAGAQNIDVVAPSVTPRLAAGIEGAYGRHHARSYRPSDLNGAVLVIATEGDPVPQRPDLGRRQGARRTDERRRRPSALPFLCSLHHPPRRSGRCHIDGGSAPPSPYASASGSKWNSAMSSAGSWSWRGGPGR